MTIGISNAELEEVLFDLGLEQSGGRILIGVDPRDVEDFCFPHQHNLDISKISDSQTAFFEVFYGLDRWPQVLAEHGAELEAMTAHFARQGREAIRRAELIERLVSAVPPAVTAEISSPPTLDSIANHFHIVLAIVMGIYRIGLDRLNEIYGRLRRNALPPDVAAIVSSISRRYERSALADLMFDKALGFISRQQRLSPHKRQELRGAVYADVCAIDRLIFLNNELEEAFIRGEISNRVIFLYTSSTDKTQFLFALPEVKEKCPVVDGRPVNLYRSRTQLLYYTIHRKKGATAIETARYTAENLAARQEAITLARHIQLVRRLSSRLSSQCPECVLDGGAPETSEKCPWRSMCEKVKTVQTEVNALRRNVQNLCLIARIEEYRAFLGATTNQPRLAAFLECFREVFTRYGEEREQTAEALARVDRLATLIKAKNTLSEFLASACDISSDKREVHRGQDMITSPVQHLPTQLVFRDERHGRIFEDLVAVYTAPVPLRADRLALLEAASEMFLDLDADVTDLDSDHEILRCCVYLAFSAIGGNERACTHADEMSGCIEDRRDDFTYILLWGLRRSRKFDKAEDTGRDAIRRWPSDPRFYHGCALNTLARLWDDSGGGSESWSSQLYTEAKRNIETAIELYGKQDIIPRDLIAVCYKDLALFCSQDPKSVVYNVTAARSAIEKLKEYAPVDWYSSGYPEYLHAEAQVCLAEYRLSRERNVEKLVGSIGLVERAIDIYEKPLFKELLKQARFEAAKTAFVHVTLIPRFSDKPTFHDTAVIAGRVSKGKFDGAVKIVLYAQTDQWWVQPDNSDPDTKIVDDRWQNQTHLGSQYAALLVRREFEVVSPVKVLPGGESVLAKDIRLGVF